MPGVVTSAGAACDIVLAAGAEDVLRLQKPITAIDRKGLIAEGELGRRIADVVLGAMTAK